MKYKLSVIITSYNHADTLMRAIDSVLSQKTTFPFQVIIVDDGSTDESRTLILQKFLKDNRPKNVVVCLPPHGGIMKTYQRGLQECEGEYFTFCDCDDYKLPNAFQTQVSVMDANDYDFTVTRVFVDDCKNEMWCGVTDPIEVAQKKVTFDGLLKGTANVHAQSYMIRKSAFDRYVDFDRFVSLGLCVWDYPIVLEFIRHAPIKYLDFNSAVFCRQDESVTLTRKRSRRLRYILGREKIRLYFIFKYGCKPSTIAYLAYRFLRDILSVILKRWK